MSDFFEKIESENSQLVAYVEAEMQKQGVVFGKDFAITVTASLVSALTGTMLGSTGTVSLQDEIIQSALVNTYANGASYGTTIAIEGGTTVWVLVILQVGGKRLCCTTGGSWWSSVRLIEVGGIRLGSARRSELRALLLRCHHQKKLFAGKWNMSRTSATLIFRL